MKRRALLRAVSLALSLAAAAGCKRQAADDEATMKEAFADKKTVEVLEQTAAAEYDPPADGKLTERQIEMYLAVKEREQRIREVARKSLEEKSGAAKQDDDMSFVETLKALGDVGDIAAADLRAAQELGHNPKEYQWVEERVMEALLTDLSRRLEGQLAEGREQYVELLEAQKEKVTDPGQLAKIDEQIAEARRDMEQQGAAAAAEPPNEALAHNAALVERYRDRIQAGLTPEERFAVGEWEGEAPAEASTGAAAPEQR